jgi:hypothetical protein
MLNHSTVLLVRHAEKPASGKGLAPMGEARAEGYAGYFPSLPLDRPGYDFLFAAKDSDESHRPRLTLTPLSQRIDVPIEMPWADKDYGPFAAMLLGKPDYTHKNIVICWHHGEILELASLLLKGNEAPKHANWPKAPWPGDVFGWLLWISYDKDENPTSKTCCYR